MMSLGKSGKKIMIIIGGIKDNLTSYMPFLTRKAMAKNHSFSFFYFISPCKESSKT